MIGGHGKPATLPDMSATVVFDTAGAKVRLDDISTRPPKKTQKAEAHARFDELNDELFTLQDLMWGAKTHSLLIVLQGRDGAGKDGTVKHVVGGLNPRGVSVISFGVPSEEELRHDFLWRVHLRTPRLGEVSIFNRSHYEDVLVVRVHDLVKKSVWKARYAHINDFESVLAEQGCIILKFFLHISPEEQDQRISFDRAAATKSRLHFLEPVTQLAFAKAELFDQRDFLAAASFALEPDDRARRSLAYRRGRAVGRRRIGSSRQIAE